ncbi:hypothetical protein BTUL_0236g00070 [Botrytis tulipae]|uniref:Uncharacterized protein n=1 Tax=Botrytis tulipae TaxID=87230 RepID=A0A4Z1EF63_9HELO|nr:hypothetical protein BTUL_0236g00070 [Botrytis tulipae]
MESKENKLPCGSQTSTPTNTTSPNSPKDDSIGRLTTSRLEILSIGTIPNRGHFIRPKQPIANFCSSVNHPFEHRLIRLSLYEFDAFSQKVGITSLEEAKHHLQNLGPVPKFPNPAEIEIRKLVEQEENKIIQEEHKSIRRDSVSFLKRRTSERKTNLATPTLTITTECFRNSPVLSPAVSPARSPTPPDSAVTRIELAAPILGSSSIVNMVASPDTLQLDKEQTVPARDTPITAYTGPFGISNLVLTPIEQENTTSQGQADEHAAKNIASSSSRSATPVFPPRVSSMAPPPPTVVAGWVSDEYTSNYGTPPTSAAQTMGAHPWQDKIAGFTVTPIVSSSGQPDTRQPYSVELLSGASFTSSPDSSRGEATSNLISSSDGSKFEFGKRGANNSPVAEMELEHKKTNPDALNADGVESSDGISGVPQQQ